MKKRNFSSEFKRESAQLVVDQNYTVADAASAMDVGLSTMTRWVKQLRDERRGNHQGIRHCQSGVVLESTGINTAGTA